MARIFGTLGNDKINGNYDVFDVIDGRAGNDVIADGGTAHGSWLYGRGGNDTLYGTDAHDRLYGGDGDDALFGDSDYGDLYFASGGLSDRIYGGNGNDYADGGGGDDIVAGQAGDDWIEDITGNNHLLGGLGADVVRGTGLLDGGGGNDTIENNSWADSTMRGGPGADLFLLDVVQVDPIYTHTTTLADYSPAQGDRVSVQVFMGYEHHPDGTSSPINARGAEAFKLFDDNGTGVLGDGDTYAVNDGQEHIDLQYWSTKFVLPEAMATPEHWDSSAVDWSWFGSATA